MSSTSVLSAPYLAYRASRRAAIAQVPDFYGPMRRQDLDILLAAENALAAAYREHNSVFGLRDEADIYMEPSEPVTSALQYAMDRAHTAMAAAAAVPDGGALCGRISALVQDAILTYPPPAAAPAAALASDEAQAYMMMEDDGDDEATKEFDMPNIDLQPVFALAVGDLPPLASVARHLESAVLVLEDATGRDKTTPYTRAIVAALDALLVSLA